MALPVCLLSGIIARAEETTAPMVNEAVIAPEVDPDILEFQKIWQGALEMSTEHFVAIQKNFNDAFKGHEDLLIKIGQKYPDVVATLQNGDKVIAANLGAILIGPVAL